MCADLVWWDCLSSYEPLSKIVHKLWQCAASVFLVQCLHQPLSYWGMPLTVGSLYLGIMKRKKNVSKYTPSHMRLCCLFTILSSVFFPTSALYPFVRWFFLMDYAYNASGRVISINPINSQREKSLIFFWFDGRINVRISFWFQCESINCFFFSSQAWRNPDWSVTRFGLPYRCHNVFQCKTVYNTYKTRRNSCKRLFGRQGNALDFGCATCSH